MNPYIRILCIFLIWTGSLFSQTVEHDPPVLTEPGKPLPLTVRVYDTEEYTIECYYAINDAEEYERILLDKLAPSQYGIDIQLPEQVSAIKYYFVINQEGAFIQTLPEKNPIMMPYSVVNATPLIPLFTVLAPNVDRIIDRSSDVLFVIRNNFPASISLIKAILNDDEPLTIVSKSALLVTLKTQFPLRDGRNRLLIVAEDKDGNIISRELMLTVNHPKQKRPVESSGYVNVSHKLYSTDKVSSYAHEPHEMTYSTSYKVKLPYVDMHVYGLYDNRDSRFRQPYSRVYGALSDSSKRWSIHVGDIQHRYSPLSINGRRIRGLKADIDLLKAFNRRSSLKVSILSGQSNKAISISSGNVSSATFEQEVVGGQINFSSLKVKSAVHYFKIKDKEASLSTDDRGTTAPIENHLLGVYLKVRPTPLSYIENEFLAAAYYSDTEAVTVNANELDLPKSIQSIIENHLPLKTSLTAGYMNKLTAQVPVFSKDRIAKIGYDIVHPSFVNVLHTSIQSDKKELSMGVTQKLLDKRWILSTTYKNKQNNILNTQSDTSFSNSYRVQSVYRTKAIGALTLTGMISRKQEEVVTLNASLDNQLNYIVIGLSEIPLTLNVGDVKANIHISLSEYIDYLSSKNSSYTNTISLLFRSEYHGYIVTVSGAQSLTRSQLNGTLGYLTVGAGVRKLFDNTLSISSKLKCTFGRNDSDENQINNQKIINQWALRYKLKEMFRFKSSQVKAAIDLIYMNNSIDPDDKDSNFFESYISVGVTNLF